ncbi:MAG: helix-turn-helix domain-containing protein [Polyangiales bacterium]
MSGVDDEDGDEAVDVEVDAENASADEALELFREPDPEDGEEPVEPLRVQHDGPAVEVDREGDKEPAPPAPVAAPRAASVESPAQQRPLRVVVVGGARGGVGKTVLAANLGLYLATIGRKVVLVDADPAGANLHTCLGTAPAVPLSKMRRPGRSEAPRAGTSQTEALRESPIRGLQLLHLGLDEPGASGARAEKLTRLMSGLRELDADYVVVDLGVGLSRETLDHYLAADLALFVTVPEPTAIENTYRFLRGAFVRYLLQQTPDAEASTELERRMRALGGAPPPLDLLHELEQEGHALAEPVQRAIERFRPHVVINQTRLRADLELGFAMQSAVRRRLGITLDYVGHIDHDDTVWTCIRNRRPLLLEVPGAKSSRKIEKIARHLLMLDSGKAPAMRLSGVPHAGHHDLLEIERGASDEDIRRAYKRARDVYAHDALCCYGLYEPHEIEKLRARLDEAFDVLVDPARRRPYELSVFPDEPEPRPEAAEAARDEEPARPPPDVTPDTQFTGALLRQVRESQRMTLHEINQRTKISLPYLKAIEDDDFGRLPELVYTSGFLKELGRHLRLDPQQVSRTYVGRYKRYLDDKQRAFARKG